MSFYLDGSARTHKSAVKHKATLCVKFTSFRFLMFWVNGWMERMMKIDLYFLVVVIEKSEGRRRRRRLGRTG